jgi:dsDNA-specific endonuclease/ATPase MutS2
MVGFVDRYVTKTRKKEANSPLLEEIKKYIAIEKSKQEDQNQVKKLKEKAKKPQPKKQEQKKIDEYQQHKIVLGSTVKLISTRQTGTVESVDGDAVTVAFGFIRMKVERNKLWWMS